MMIRCQLWTYLLHLFKKINAGDNMVTDRIISILRFAVILKDEITQDKNVIGEVFLKVQGMRLQPVRQQDRIFFVHRFS
ncbi:MAG: hypothetical protein C3F06_11830 [Candidatus Methanoperedenaceae archaeon]|nr:MAG: hypothetical protein C3F06_11830 [Candidatus Methanoperedenaceae archaeon]